MAVEPSPDERRLAEDQSVTRLMEAEHAADPETAIRLRARRLIEAVRSLGPWNGPPFDMGDLASLQGLKVEQTFDLKDGQDACVLFGRVLLNARKPLTRQRYSLAHEVGHTLFPDYEESVCAAGRFYRSDAYGESEFERLCQIAASELLFPKGAFEERLSDLGLGIAVAIRLAGEFGASVEAATRRMAELAPVSSVALTFRPVSEEGRWMNLDGALGHNPHAPLEAIGVAVSPRFLGTVPQRLRPPKNSVADRAWKRVILAGNKVAIQTRKAEVWPAIHATATWTAEAVTLPKAQKIPRQVLVLLWAAN